jgi:hypothetical protein
MRIVLLVFIALLAGCNTSDDDSNLATQQQVSQAISAIPSEATQVAALQTQVKSLQASLNKLQLIGNAHGTATNGSSPDSFRTMGELQANSTTFGPCTDMGVLLGRGDNADSQDPLSAPIESFQQCTGYEYSVTVATNTVSIGPRIFWDGPNCTGNMYEWNSGGGSYNDQTLEGGVVFLSPVDGQTSLMVKRGQTPQSILIQSAWVTSNPICQADVETQNLYSVTPNDISITGVPMLSLGQFQLTAP